MLATGEHAQREVQSVLDRVGQTEALNPAGQAYSWPARHQKGTKPPPHSIGEHNHPNAATICPMDDENLSGLLVGRADASDWTALAKIDSVVAAGDHARRDSIRRWCEHGLVLMARDVSGPLGYSVLEYTFFEQGFVTMLTVAPSARRRGVGTHLLTAVEATCTTPKLFTSTNVSNHPMQRLLQRAGWHPAGLLHGLDEGDPEIFYLCPSTRLRDAVGAYG